MPVITLDPYTGITGDNTLVERMRRGWPQAPSALVMTLKRHEVAHEVIVDLVDFAPKRCHLQVPEDPGQFYRAQVKLVDLYQNCLRLRFDFTEEII